MELKYFRNNKFPNRYIAPESLHNFLQENFKEYITEIGRSYMNQPIYMLRYGSGSINVLAWSQMHGNESNATHAMLDLLESFKHQKDLEKRIFNKITLDFIFMLNPDGSKMWTRRNALDIDMNRDFLKLSSKEFPLLKNIADQGNYHYAFNLHEQRTIYSTDNLHPATLSFLAPAQNVEREITLTRKKAMAVISKIYQELVPILPGRIGRYNDEFYPTSTGDNFTKMGIPTILYEGGHFENDYKRVKTREFYTQALYKGFKAIGELNGSLENWELYLEIPENQESHYDIIYRNVKLNTDFPCVLDIAIQYREEIKDGEDEISFVPIVVEVGDIRHKKGWIDIDATGKFFKSENKFPKLDAVQNFELI